MSSIQVGARVYIWAGTSAGNFAKVLSRLEQTEDGHSFWMVDVDNIGGRHVREDYMKVQDNE